MGEIATRANAAADSIDRAVAGDGHELLVAALMDLAQAQFVAAEQALRAAELVFDVGGGSATLGAQSGPALAQRAHRGQPQPAGVQGRRGRRVPPHRRGTADLRSVLTPRRRADRPKRNPALG